MSISMSVTNEYPIEIYPTPQAVDGGRGTSWTATRQSGKVSHIEEIVNDQGDKILDHTEAIDFTCGSGTRGCSYFVFDKGRFFQSPLTWYSESKKWDLSPGYKLPFHPRFERFASDGCLACHAGRMNPIAGERNSFDLKKPFHELSIGCERCHGPGQDHIAFHENSQNKGSKKDPIVNPEKLSPELREAVCYQCHLQGEQRVARYGRSEYDFRPGMHVSDIWITFLKSGDTSGGKTNAVSQVEQMHLSKCFVESKGEMGCISCHDAHGSPAPENRVTFYRDRCVSCHQADDQTSCSMPVDKRIEKSPKDSCIVCHMPSLDAGDVAHTAQTDHRVHVPGDGYEFKSESKDGFRVWNDKQVPVFEVERAKTIALSYQAVHTGSSAVAEKALSGLNFFHPVAADDLELNEALAKLYRTIGDSEQASSIWYKLLEDYPQDEELLVSVAQALHKANRFQEAYTYYKRLWEISDRRPQVLLNYLDACTKLNRINEGMKIALRVIELKPGSQLAHQWLAKAYEANGEADKAAYHQKLADQLQPEK